jgi:Flp pilus assembly protein TadG
MMRHPLSILRDKRGMSVVEFGLIAPVFLTLLLGVLDMGHTLYMQSILQGAMQKVARDGTLENQSTSALESQLRTQVQKLVSDATVTLVPRYFKNYTKAAQATAEPFTDTNGNGRCDAGEPYTDTNFNNTWDADGGNSGQGGAKDTVVLTGSVSYPRLFPIFRFVGMGSTVNLQATTVLVNQPYGDQAQYGSSPPTRNCP